MNHNYEVDYCLLINVYIDVIYRKLKGPFLDPYTIVQIYKHRAVYIDPDAVTERILYGYY